MTNNNHFNKNKKNKRKYPHTEAIYEDDSCIVAPFTLMNMKLRKFESDDKNVIKILQHYNGAWEKLGNDMLLYALKANHNASKYYDQNTTLKKGELMKKDILMFARNNRAELL